MAFFKNSVSMNQAVSAVRDLLDSKGWKYSYDDSNHRFTLKFNQKSKVGSVEVRVTCRPQSNDSSSCLRIYSYGYVGLRADADCMADVCEYLTRANYGLMIGNFEMDHSDGEIRYKVCVNAKSALPGEDALDDLVTLPVLMFEKYGNGLLAVSMGMMSPKAAIEQAESK